MLVAQPGSEQDQHRVPRGTARDGEQAEGREVHPLGAGRQRDQAADAGDQAAEKIDALPCRETVSGPLKILVVEQRDLGEPADGPL